MSRRPAELKEVSVHTGYGETYIEELSCGKILTESNAVNIKN
jgi:hypothetical protein